MLLEIGIFSSHLIWLFRTRYPRIEAKRSGKTFDDIAGQYEMQGVNFKFAERKSTRPSEKTGKSDEEMAPNVEDVDAATRHVAQDLVEDKRGEYEGRGGNR